MIRVKKDDSISKAIDRSKLVLVEVNVSAKTGQYRAHRWKKPTVAMDEVKKDLKKQGVNEKTPLIFEDKQGKKRTEKEVLESYQKYGKGKTLQQFIKEKYKGIEKEKTGVKQKEATSEKKTKNTSTKDNEVDKEKFLTYAQNFLDAITGDITEILNDTKQFKNLKKMEAKVGATDTIEDTLLNTGEFESVKGKIRLKQEYNTPENIEFWKLFIDTEFYRHKFEKNFTNRVAKYNGSMLYDAKRSLAQLRSATRVRDGGINKKDKAEIEEYINLIDAIRAEEVMKAKRSASYMIHNITKDKEIPITNNYEKVNSNSEFLQKAQSIKDFSQTEFAIASMDMLKVNMPLVLGRSIETSGSVNYSVNAITNERIFESLRLNTATKSSELAKKSTVLHELTHTQFPYGYDKSFEEPLVEASAIYMTGEIYGNEKKDIPSYSEYIVPLLPVLKGHPTFSDCKSIGDFGKIIAEATFGGDHDLIEGINGYIKDNQDKMTTESTVRLMDQYLSNTNMTSLLEKHEPLVNERIKNSYADENATIPGMATLISALKSGSLTIDKALNNPELKSTAYILLACILDEEGIEEIEEFLA